MTKHERMLAALDVYKNGNDKAEMSQLAAESADCPGGSTAFYGRTLVKMLIISTFFLPNI